MLSVVPAFSFCCSLCTHAVQDKATTRYNNKGVLIMYNALTNSLAMSYMNEWPLTLIVKINFFNMNSETVFGRN